MWVSSDGANFSQIGIVNVSNSNTGNSTTYGDYYCFDLGSITRPIYYVRVSDSVLGSTPGFDVSGIGATTMGTLQYSWNMDTNPGWTTQDLWAWGPPLGGGGQQGETDPISGYTGSNVYGYHLSGDYENNLPEKHLTSTAINCMGLSNVSLKFQRWLGVESPSYDHAYVRVSNNGIAWTTVWQNSSSVRDTSWVLQDFDISSVADGQPTVYLRWTMGTTDSSYRYCGWNIDDVEIWGVGGEFPMSSLFWWCCQTDKRNISSGQNV